MKEIEKIVEALETLSPYSEDEILEYTPLLESEAELTSQRIKTAGEALRGKAIMLAAARINYKIALIKQGGDRVKSFKAGDISISEGNEALENAKALLDEIEADCPELAGHRGFAFKTV